MTSVPFSYAMIAPALPEIVLLALTGVLLVADLYMRAGRERSTTYVLSQAALAVAALVTASQMGGDVQVALNGMYVSDLLGQVLKVAVIVTVMATLSMGRRYLALRGLLTGEFLSLALLGTVGMMVMVSAHHFLTLYLGLELMALAQYGMVGLERDSARATEAAMKYFVLGALASGLLLYGMSMIYGATASLDLAQVADSLANGNAHAMLGVFGLVFVVSGIAFKLGAAPFHMWIPDVYHGAATATTLYIGTAPKLAALGFILRLLAQGLEGMTGDWQQMLVVLSVASLLVGNVVAIAQSNLKRMLAYSTIAHMGFLTLGIIAGNGTGYGAALFYGITYMLMTLGSFGAILLLSRAGFEAENIDDFRGLNQKSRWYAFMMLIVMFSLAGIPPTVGFFAKLVVLQAVLDAGYTWLVVYAVLISVVGAFYYLRIVRLMYMEAPADEITVDPHLETRWVLSASCVATLVLGILPAPLLDLCVRAVTASF